MGDKSILIIQMIYTPKCYISILGVNVINSTSGKIKLFVNNKEIIEPYSIIKSNNKKFIKTANYTFDFLFFLKFLINNLMITSDGIIIKPSFNI